MRHHSLGNGNQEQGRNHTLLANHHRQMPIQVATMLIAVGENW